jgi:hypothetical protein
MVAVVVQVRLLAQVVQTVPTLATESRTLTKRAATNTTVVVVVVGLKTD